MKLNKLLAMVSLILSASPALADWTMIQTSDNGNMYIDFDSVKKADGLVQVLTLNDYYVPQGKNEMSSTWLELHDCKNKKFKALSIKYYVENMAAGGLLSTYALPEAETAWADVVPYSIGELKANVICSK